MTGRECGREPPDAHCKKWRGLNQHKLRPYSKKVYLKAKKEKDS